MPIVSVIVPVFNREGLLPETLDSVSAQTLQDWECIVVDDGSTDASLQVALGYAARDARFQAFRRTSKTKGANVCRNEGLQRACGQYLQFLDSDDVIYPRKFELQVAVLQTVESPALVTCNYCYGDATNVWHPLPRSNLPRAVLDVRKPLEDLTLNWENGLSIPCHSFLFDARLFRDGGIRFYEPLPNHQDWHCWMDVLALHPEVFHVPQLLAVYRPTPNSLSSDWPLKRQGFLQAIRSQLRKHAEDPEMVRLLKQKTRMTKRRYAGYTFIGRVFTRTRSLVSASPLGAAWRGLKARMGAT